MEIKYKKGKWKIFFSSFYTSWQNTFTFFFIKQINVINNHLSGEFPVEILQCLFSWFPWWYLFVRHTFLGCYYLFIISIFILMRNWIRLRERMEIASKILVLYMNNDSWDYVIRLKEMRKLKSHIIWQDVLFVSDYYIPSMYVLYILKDFMLLEWSGKSKE